MRYPLQDNVTTSKDMVTTFSGLDAKLTSCTEGEFFDMKNITTQYYPVLSPRNKRRNTRTLTELDGILGGDKPIWVTDIATGPTTKRGLLFIDYTPKYSVTLTSGAKQIYKMGAIIVIFPDKVWYNIETSETGNLEMKASSIASSAENKGKVSISPCKADGTSYTANNEAYYKSHTPKSGDVMYTTNADGKVSYKVYSELTTTWATMTSTYLKFNIADLEGVRFRQFKEDDGVKISLKLGTETTDTIKSLRNVFVNDDGNGWFSVNTTIKKIISNYSIAIPGILDIQYQDFVDAKVERTVPDMAYITECQNRLWGCSTDGHEIYCCKLGDVTNWNYFSGTAMDSYAATVGSDGEFTGAVTYNNNPIFFKEQSFLKVTVSSTGAHSYREQIDRGVQKGSSQSICNVNGVLYYKGITDVYAFDGSSPISVGEALGEHRYSDAICGTINGRYYMSVKDSDNNRMLFVYDTAKGLWAKEDNIKVKAFCNIKENLMVVDNSYLYCIDGSGTGMEKDIEWFAESGYIGFSITGKKYVSKINIRMSLEMGAYCDLWIQYDEDNKWKHLINMSGKGTKSFTVPVTIQRCDHFRYKISGKGGCKIYSISKTVEEGSDV